MARTALITGASKGIGKACAILFAKSGYNVIINYNKSKEEALRLEKELKDIGANVLVIQADVSNLLDVELMIQKSLSEFKLIDVLINNAGISSWKLFCDVSYDEWQEILGTNVMGTVNVCKYAVPGMIRNHSGNIINISSIWGICGASMEVAYSTSKAAIIGFTKALAKELGPSNIRVNCVAPGVIDTNMNSSLSNKALNVLKDETPLGVLGNAEDIADACLFLSSDMSRFITGQVLSPNGGFVI